MTLKAVAITGGGGGGGISGSGGSPYVARWSGATSLTTGVLVDTGTRVGILQTSPVSTFQVGGNTVATASPVGVFCTLASDSRFTADDGTRAVTLAANGTNAIVGTTTAHDLLVQTNGSTKLFVQDSTGRIGVGNTDPATLIETYGTTGIRASSDTVANVGVFQYSSDTSPATLTLRKARGTRAAQTTVATGDAMGSVNFTAYGGTSGSVLSSISGSVVAYTSNANISSNLTFGTSASGAATPTTRLTIDEAGVSTFTGPVRATGTTQTAPAFSRHDSTTSGIYFPGVNEIGFTISNQHAMYISTGRNIGIQNSTPNYPLHVGGGNNTGIVTTGPAAYVATNGATSIVVRDATNGIESFLYAGSSVVLAGAASNHPYQIRTNNATRITVSAAGDTSIANTLSFNSGYGSAAVAYGCRAWVTFTGVAVPVIQADGGVSTVTNLAAGNYSVNFDTTMADENYAAHVAIGHIGGVTSAVYGAVDRTGAQTPAQLRAATRVFSFNNVGTPINSTAGTMVYVSVFR